MIFEKDLTVAYAETGINGKLKPASILNYLQDVASEHTGVLGVSAFDLFPRDLAWVVFRYHIRIFAYPRWKDALRIRTWRCPLNNLYELRQYEIFDSRDQLIISSKSAWILTRLSTKKPVRLNKNMTLELMETRQRPIDDDLPDLPEMTEPNQRRSFCVRMHDLDFNRHVNNSVYAVWALESAPEEIVQTLRPKEIIIHYLGESLYGDTVTSRTKKLESNPSHTFLHAISSQRSGKEITRIKTVWDCFD